MPVSIEGWSESDKRAAVAQTGEMTVRIGFLGCGLIARSHARRLVEVDGADISICFDPDVGRARTFAADHDAVVATGEVEVYAKEFEILNR